MVARLDRCAKLTRFFLLSCWFVVSVLAIPTSQAQQGVADKGGSQLTPLPLDSFSQITADGENWKIVGSATASRSTDLDMTTRPGQGILANDPSGGETGLVYTNFPHDDLALELEVMIPKGTDSGIFLQGRYEIQLADSWGAKIPDPAHHASVSGIKPPSINVARAPGLWQKLEILFRAPRFNDSGQKTANAVLVRVILNGITVQEEVELEGPTQGAPLSDEASSGPLMFQGDNGPVAFRNIRYSLLSNGPVEVENLSYNYYRGDFGWELPELETLARVGGGETSTISSALADTLNRFALHFQGDMIVPSSGQYTFEVTYTGQFALKIDGQTVVDIDAEEIGAVGDVPRKAAITRLSAGTHTFELTYARGRWHVAQNALGLYVSGPGSIRTRLSAVESDPNDVWAEFKVDPGDKPRLQRGFVMHPSGERVHAISVGYPNGNHYAYDTGTGSLLHLWRGRFIDTSTMWFSRGNDQLAAPQGSLIELSGLPVVASGREGGAPVGEFRFRSYQLDSEGNPTFAYSVGSVKITDAIKPASSGYFFSRTLTVDPGDVTVPIRLASAREIIELADGVFSIADGVYQIEVVTGSAAIVQAGDSMELAVTVEPGAGAQVVKTNIVW